MKVNQPLSKQVALAIFLFFVVLACQDDSVIEDVQPVDEDMVLATQLAESYMSTLSRGSSTASNFAVTVLKSKDELAYKTNLEGGPYEGIGEETVTAMMRPGSYIFWSSGGGLSDLVGIEFDAASQALLGNAPFEVLPGRMWAVRIPNDILNQSDDDDDDDDDDDRSVMLKYDILYSLKHSNEVIRLDPKIKVSH